MKHLLDRNYLRANDAYLEMAIGNAPWPIGVTMVGIHARTGREKISDKNVAHVLNDEIQRKYIQVRMVTVNLPKTHTQNMRSLFLLSGCETVDDRKSKVLSDRPLSHGQLRGTERLK